MRLLQVFLDKIEFIENNSITLTCLCQNIKKVRKMFFRLVTSVGQRKNSESPWGIEPQTFGFRASMLYHWATETPRWAWFITKFIWHASCCSDLTISLVSNCSIVQSRILWVLCQIMFLDLSLTPIIVLTCNVCCPAVLYPSWACSSFWDPVRKLWLGWRETCALHRKLQQQLTFIWARYIKRKFSKVF